jgi:HlyD family secretion protein
MNTSLRYVWLLAAPILLIACDGKRVQDVPVEVIKKSAWQDVLEADGVLRSQKITPLNVPGSGFEARRVVKIADDGAAVKKDDVLAEFSAETVQRDLSQQQIELLRNALVSAGQQTQDKVGAAQLQTEIAQTAADLQLSEHYMGIKADWIAQNELLDKLQDVGFMRTKRGTLDWRLGQQDKRAAAQANVTNAMRASIAETVTQKQASLRDLQLLAPYDGIFLLEENWDGSKFKVGGGVYAGNDFATISSTGDLVAKFSIPQSRTEGLAVGQRAILQFTGGRVALETAVSRVGSSASVKSRGSPVKFVEFDIAISAQQSAERALSPGESVSVHVFVHDRLDVLSVPNIALVNSPQGMKIQLANGEMRIVKLGERGNVRSEILQGLLPGDQIVLTPSIAEPSS